VTWLLLYVLLWGFLLRRVPLPIRVSPETRQRLQRLRTERRLYLGYWLRAGVGEGRRRVRLPKGADAAASDQTSAVGIHGFPFCGLLSALFAAFEAANICALYPNPGEFPFFVTGLRKYGT